jgi:hypothetical protein
MHYFVLGGTGFIGTHLIAHLVDQGHKVTALVRSAQKKPPQALNTVNVVQGDPLAPGAWQEHLCEKKVDAVVNLIGNPIIQRWNPKLKQAIHDTRILSTRMVVQALAHATDQTTFFCANATGYFDDRGNKIVEDDAPPGDDFLAEICQKWQQEAEAAQEHGHRVIVGRFAPVIGRGGGLLSPMLPAFKAGVGGILGNGHQWMSWIHVQDLCRAIAFTVDHPDLDGPLNMTAPKPVTNRHFTSALGKVLHRPTLMRVPAFVLKLVYGEASEAILDSQRCIPVRLKQTGFSFHFAEIEAALEDVCG